MKENGGMEVARELRLNLSQESNTVTLARGVRGLRENTSTVTDRRCIAVRFDVHTWWRTTRRRKRAARGTLVGEGFYRRISIALHSLKRVCSGCGGKSTNPTNPQTDFLGLVISQRQVGRKDNAKVRRRVKDDMDCLF